MFSAVAQRLLDRSFGLVSSQRPSILYLGELSLLQDMV